MRVMAIAHNSRINTPEHGYLDDQSPDQFETAYAAATTDQTNTGIHNKQPAHEPG